MLNMLSGILSFLKTHKTFISTSEVKERNYILIIVFKGINSLKTILFKPMTFKIYDLYKIQLNDNLAKLFKHTWSMGKCNNSANHAKDLVPA